MGLANVQRLLSEKDVAGLVGRLGDRDYDTRCAAAQALAELQAVGSLIAALKRVALTVNSSDSNRLTYEYAKKALALIQAPAVEPLIAVLQEGALNVRLAALEVLGKIGNERAVEALTTALSDPESSVRFAAVRALNAGGIPAMARAVEPLIAFMTNRSVETLARGFAAQALGKSRDQRAVAPLLAALQGDDLDVDREAAYALAELGGIEFIEPLVAAVVRKPNERLFDAVESSLRRLGRPAVTPLISILQSHPSRVARQLAATALQGIGTPQAIEPLIAALQDPEKYVRAQVAGGLGKVGAQLPEEAARWRIVQVLTPVLLSDTEADCRHAAAWALEQLAEPQAIDPLIAALQDTDGGTRHDAARALAAITGEDLGEDAVLWQEWRDRAAPAAAVEPSPYRPCPSCGSSGSEEIEPVKVTWWGGTWAPRLFNLVRCRRCGTTYNGKTGQTGVRAVMG